MDLKVDNYRGMIKFLGEKLKKELDLLILLIAEFLLRIAQSQTHLLKYHHLMSKLFHIMTICTLVVIFRIYSTSRSGILKRKLLLLQDTQELVKQRYLTIGVATQMQLKNSIIEQNIYQGIF